MWDSGRIASGDFLEVHYGGPALQSGTTYFWKLRVWDQAGKESPWSNPATWTTALLHPSDWSAKWIAADADGPRQLQALEHSGKVVESTTPLPIFRRDFRIDKPIKQAIVSVSGLGQYELHLNGRNVTDSVLNPGWTNYRKTTLYNTYDLTALLHQGNNSFGMMLGSGMYDVPGVKGRYTKFIGSFGQPKMILQLHIIFADGSQTTIVSDRRWKTASGPITFSSIYGGEDFDARKETPGWDSPGFRDTDWSSAIEVAGPNGDASNPGSELSGKIIPAIQAAQSFMPVKVTEPAPGIKVYDLGQNFSGWPEITVSGKRGSTIRLLPGELLDAKGLVTQASAGAGSNAPVLFSYTLKGSGIETWHPRFTYYGFRYVQVETTSASADKPVVLSLKGKFVHDAVNIDGEFTSTLPLFNRIHHLIDMAILSNMVSVLSDCPTREKLGWLEQTHLAGTSIMYNYGVLELYEKIANDMVDAQLPNGMVPGIAPEYVAFVDSKGVSTNFRDSPEWGSAIILSPWTAYQSYGDTEILAKHYDAMRRYAHYLRDKSQRGLLTFGLGDWYDIGPNFPGESQLTSKGLTATAIYYQDLNALTRIAKLLGKDSDALEYAEEANSVKNLFNRTLFHPETNEYDRGSQTANAMPLALGLVPEEHRQAVLDNLVKDIRKHQNHVTAGDIGFHYVVRALTDGDRSDVLYDMLSKTDSPSYGYQLAKGATTLTEAWDTNPNSSQNHFMLGHAEEWFYRGLAGIDFDMSRPISQRIIIRPAMELDIAGASASFESVLGTIESSWKPVVGGWDLNVTIPSGAVAAVYLPVGVREVSEHGQPSSAADTLKLSKEKDDVTAVTIGSGQYHFVVHR
ncbi:family 78 glycoside hydrolase catalytic domain [Granulicella arctica]|uniref:alpha-L-rhamnosidase n=1 Tax=Granulicella arctica TaxID=940613 RepID=A0A7Y9PLJ3_9BACT|nr:hypothetical protein [Granulicella arctica]